MYYGVSPQIRFRRPVCSDLDWEDGLFCKRTAHGNVCPIASIAVVDRVCIYDVLVLGHVSNDAVNVFDRLSVVGVANGVLLRSKNITGTLSGEFFAVFRHIRTPMDRALPRWY